MIHPMIVHGLIRARRCQLLAITKTPEAIASASQNPLVHGLTMLPKLPWAPVAGQR